MASEVERAPEPGSAAWWTERQRAAARPRRPRADGLTLDRILDQALSLVDAEGLEALTMRRLAAELGAGHASLYRHVASHQEVVVLLVDRVLGDVALPDRSPSPPDETAHTAPERPEPPGRATAEAMLRRYRATLLAHPALTPAFLHGQLLGPNALARREEALSLLLAAGAPPALAVRAYLSLTHFVIASAAFEASGAGRTAPRRREMDDYFASLPADQYPTVVAIAPELNAVDPDEEFDLGLAALLDHFEAQIVRAGR